MNTRVHGATMKLRLFAVVLVAGAFVTGRLYSHHSFAATYHEDRTVKIEGKLVQFQFRNPHSFVHVEAPDEQGVMQRWAIEWGGAGQLGGQGVTRETLKPGDVVVITGNLDQHMVDRQIRVVTLRMPSDAVDWGGNTGVTCE